MSEDNAGDIVACCGRKPEHDTEAKSEDGRCPHCGSTALIAGYGLAAGGMGSYQVCDDCGLFCGSVQDDGP